MTFRESGIRTFEQKKILRRKIVHEDYMQAKTRVAELTQAATEGQEMEIANYDYSAARQNLEALEFENDVTGAAKKEYFGRDLRKLYNEIVDVQGNIDPEKAGDYQIIQINMGELDRLNKGGHDLGDKALGATAEKVYEIVQLAIVNKLKEQGVDLEKVVLDDFFEVYRTDSNEFSVLLKGFDQSVAQDVLSVFQDQMKGKMPVESLPEEQALPLAVTHLNLNNIADFWPQAKQDNAGVDEGRLFVNLAMEQSQILNDIEKNRTRVERILDIKNKMSPEQAKNFYDEFLKKSLGKLFNGSEGSDLLEYEDFLRLLNDNQGEYLIPSIKAALIAFKERSREQKELADKVIEFVLIRIKDKDALILNTEKLLGPKSDESEVSNDMVEVKDEEEFLQSYTPTQGEKILQELTNEKNRIKSMLDGDPDNALLQARLKDAEAKLRNETVRRNPATGLYERGMFFRNIEGALDNNRPITSIAIDMAFLKYFDREGGRLTGNSAILVAARVMDNIVSNLPKHLNAQVYRVGGDEFSISLETDDPETIRQVQIMIAEAGREAVIPATDSTRSSKYRPEGLLFNFGAFTAPNKRDFRRQMQEAGFVFKHPEDSELGTKELADLLVRVADRQIEIEKTIQRLMFLTVRQMEENQGQGRGNLASLKDYSMKAIGGEKGLQQVNIWVDEMEEDVKNGGAPNMAELQRKVLDYVITQGIAEQREQESRGQFVDKLMEASVKEQFLIQRMHELQRKINHLTMSLQSASQENIDLKKQIADLQAEKDVIVGLRQKITS